MKKSLPLFILLLIGTISYGQPYIPDSTFSNTGKTNFNFFNNIDRSYGCVVQADQKIVIVGLSKNNGTGFFELCIARFNGNGTIDNTFGSSGITKVSMGNQGSIGGMTPRIKIAPDGKFVAINSGRAPSGGSLDMMVCRLDTAGNLDLSFNSTGVLFVDITSANTQPDMANALAIDAYGNIYVTGVAGIAPPFDNEFAVIKVTSAGLLDPSFNLTGIKIYNPTGGNEFGEGIAIQQDGKIVFGGSASNKMFLGRIDSTGAYDLTFNTTGMLPLNFSTSSDMADLAIDSLGRIIVAGTSTSNAIAVARVLTTGTLDATFGTSGYKTFQIAFQTNVVGGMQLVSDNKILVAGSTGNNASAIDFFVTRVDSTGNLDLTFNSNGYLTASISPGTYEDDAHAISTLADGRIFVCGTSILSSAVNEDVAMLMIKPVNISSGISTASSLNYQAVYPNPAKSELTISSTKKSEVSIIDINGRAIQTIQLNFGLNKLNVESLPSGIYLVKEMNGTGSLKFVKE